MVDFFSIGFSVLCQLTILIGLLHCFIRKYFSSMTLYLGLILIIEIMGWFGEANLFLFSISYYIHLFFLGHYILIHLLRWERKKFIVLSLIFLTPMIYSLISNTEVTSYQSYDRIFYIFSIIILLIAVLFKYFDGKLFLSNTTITIFLTILFYFGIDFILALTTNYLVNEHLNLVGWIWLFRAFCLFLFYVAIVNLTWKTGKTL